MWDREKVKAVADSWAQRRAELGPAAGAALAYARWQGMTDEPGVDRDAAKQELDRQMESFGVIGVEPEHVGKLMGHVADEVLMGLMRYSLRWSMEGLAKEGSELEKGAAEGKDRKRDRMRKRERDK